LLTAGAGTADQLLTAGPQVPEPGVGLVGAFGDVAAQLRGQVRDQGRVTLVGTVASQVLTLTFAVD
jgi:hypothetical protein